MQCQSKQPMRYSQPTPSIFRVMAASSAVSGEATAAMKRSTQYISAESCLTRTIILLSMAKDTIKKATENLRVSRPHHGIPATSKTTATRDGPKRSLNTPADALAIAGNHQHRVEWRWKETHVHIIVGMIAARYTSPTLVELYPQMACRRSGMVTSSAANATLRFKCG